MIARALTCGHVSPRFHKSDIFEAHSEGRETYDGTLLANILASRQHFFLGGNDARSSFQRGWKRQVNKYKDSPNIYELRPWMVPKLFVCIERHVRYPTMSCDLDPEETLLYSKVISPSSLNGFS